MYTEKKMKKKITNLEKYLKEFPNKAGYYGIYGGSYIDDNFKKAFLEIANFYETIKEDEQFLHELSEIRKNYQGRETPVYFARNLTKLIGGANIYLKREDLNHTGAHKLNHTMAEALIAKKMGKTKLIAETGAGQHGLAVATAAAYFGLECEIHMGEVDIIKQSSNVAKMKILGAKVVVVKEGYKTLKEAVDSAFVAYSNDLKNSMYAIGSAVGPHPFPKMIRDFQSVIGKEAKRQFMALKGKLPDALVACVGGGSNAIGLFGPFLSDDIQMFGVEPLGRGEKIGDNAARFIVGEEGILHGFKSIVIKDEKGEPAPVYSIASGLDYTSVGPEHAYLNGIDRVKYVAINDEEAVEAFLLLSKTEGIIPALESAHAVAYGMKLAKEMKTGDILINLSGRGDKDVDFIIENENLKTF